jgi:type II secretory pathway component PulM
VLPRWEPSQETSTLLASFAAAFPLRRPSYLATPEMTEYLLARSEGTIGELAALLTEAAVAAIESGEEAINQRHPAAGLLRRPDRAAPQVPTRAGVTHTDLPEGLRRWPVHPEPAPGEALTSWLGRLARLYRLSVEQLLTHNLGAASAEFDRGADLDYQVPTIIVHALASRTGVTVSRLRPMTITGCVPWLAIQAVPGFRAGGVATVSALASDL